MTWQNSARSSVYSGNIFEPVFPLASDVEISIKPLDKCLHQLGVTLDTGYVERRKILVNTVTSSVVRNNLVTIDNTGYPL